MAQNLTVGQIASTLDSVPSGMITRARLEDIAQNGISRFEASFIGVTPEQAQSVARDALEITDTRFNGDVNAAVAWLEQNGQSQEYAGLTVDQASDKLGQVAAAQPAAAQPAPAVAAPEDGGEPAAEVAAAPGGAAAPEAAPAAAAAATATETAATAQNENAESLRRIMTMFNDGSFARAFESGDFTQIIEAFMTALTGQPFSMSNDSNAFAGVTTPNGTEVPAGTQVNPDSGQPVVAEADAPAAAAAAEEPRNAAVAPA